MTYTADIKWDGAVNVVRLSANGVVVARIPLDDWLALAAVRFAVAEAESRKAGRAAATPPSLRRPPLRAAGPSRE